MKKLTQQEVNKIIAKHQKWLRGEEGGERANFSNTDLSNLDLSRVNLSHANLSNANLSYANLSYANLSYANLSRVNLLYANLSHANLSHANLENIIYNESTAFFVSICPEKGSFIGFKKCGKYIVELQITEDAKRSSATSRKCRCSKAKVLSITNFDGSDSGLSKISSNRDSKFIYKIGETVEVKDFNENRWKECSTGIHFFITRDEAVRY